MASHDRLFGRALRHFYEPHAAKGRDWNGSILSMLDHYTEYAIYYTTACCKSAPSRSRPALTWRATMRS